MAKVCFLHTEVHGLRFILTLYTKACKVVLEISYVIGYLKRAGDGALIRKDN